MTEKTRFEDLLARDGKLVYPNTGVSMMPLLRQRRDLMVIVRKDLRPFGPHDAVLFKRPRPDGQTDYVMHRIIRRYEDGSCWIVGDNLLTGEKVREEQILGVLTAVVRDGKELSVDSPLLRLYVLLWGARPGLRRVLTWPVRRIRRLRRKLSPPSGKS